MGAGTARRRLVVNDFANLEQAEATAAEIRSLGRRALTIAADVSDRNAAEEIVGVPARISAASIL